MTYIIGDIHGCNRSFQALLGRLALRPGDRLVLLGDYIDRGPDSKGVIDSIFSLREAGFEVVCLRGNHEQMLLNALTDAHDLQQWLDNGGRQTMASFGADRLRDIPEPYIDFINSTLHWYETGGCLCVHGGLDFSGANPLDNPHAMLWKRNWYGDIDYQWLGNRIIVHGHTPESIEPIREQLRNLDYQRYLNLDNGCVYAHPGNRRGIALGQLLAFCPDTRALTEQKYAG